MPKGISYSNDNKLVIILKILYHENNIVEFANFALNATKFDMIISKL